MGIIYFVGNLRTVSVRDGSKEIKFHLCSSVLGTRASVTNQKSLSDCVAGSMSHLHYDNVNKM